MLLCTPNPPGPPPQRDPDRIQDELTNLQAQLDAAWQQCGTGQVRQALDRLREIAGRIDAEHTPILASRCEWLQGWAMFQLGEDEAAFCHAQRARTLADGRDAAAGARAAALCAWGLSMTGLADESYAAAAQGMTLAEQCSDQWSRVFALHALSVVTWEGGDLTGAIPLSERALAAARALGDTHLEGWILVNLACMLTDVADNAKAAGDAGGFAAGYERGITLTSLACSLAEANGDTWTRRIALTNNAEFCAYLGRYADAHRHLTEWKAIAGEIVGRRQVHFLQAEADVLRFEGRLDEALDCAVRALTLAQTEPVADMIHICVRVLSEVHEARGEFQVALQLYKRFRQLEIELEGDKVKRRARVASIVYDADRLRRQAELERARAEISEREASTDPLSGLANRRLMERAFDALLAQGHDDFVVVFADLDLFKAVNDSYSHAVGDQVIKAFAGILTGCCRQGDLVARIGGEEFVLLIAEAMSPAAATAFCDRLLASIREYPWTCIAPGLAMTASLGLVHGGEASGRDGLLALADARLYRAKAAGRDCAVTAG